MMFSGVLSEMLSLHRLCWCFGASKPDIEFNPGGDNGLKLVPLELTEPMPSSEAELDAKFAELVVRPSSITDTYTRQSF